VAQRFNAAVNGIALNAALQFAEKLTFRIRASLQRCRKFFEIRSPFRGWTSKAGFSANL